MSASLQKSLSSGTAKFDKSVDKFVKNDTYVNVLRVVLIGYSVFIDSVPNDIINLFKHFITRFIVSGFVAYLLFKDVVTALLLALCFILSIQELKKRTYGSDIMNHNNNVVSNNNGPSPNPILTGMNNMSKVMIQNASTMNDVPDNNAPENSADPAFQTLTQNLVEGSAFTTDADLEKAGSNLVQGVDPDKGVKTFVNQHGAQSLDVPLGFDAEASISSKF